MRVVSNASPLVSLARIQLLELLSQLYDEVVVPEAVWHEVVVAGVGQPGAAEVSAADWIRRQAVVHRPMVQALRRDLDAGEAEAIALAVEIRPHRLLMDERDGRQTALRLGVRVVGVVGILIDARRRGLLRVIRPHLDALRSQAGFRISQVLYERALRDADEG